MQMRERTFLFSMLAITTCGGRTGLEGSGTNFKVDSPSSAVGAGAGSTGGTTSTGGSSGSGCTGAFEEIKSNTGLCVAKVVTITPPSGYSDYNIDVTEVTMGQYDAWLATNPALPVSTDPNCGYVRSYAEQGLYLAYTGLDAGHHPVVNVDWCDAYTYCLGVGKRLCGALGGGAVEYSAGYDDENQSQWYRACSSGGTNLYPYGNAYQAAYCDGADFWNEDGSAWQTVAVGSLASCVTSTTGYAGAYDLNGNVWEWEDSCSGTGQTAPCHFRGGAFDNSSSDLSCGNYGQSDSGSNRFITNSNLGFRCCSDLRVSGR